MTEWISGKIVMKKPTEGHTHTQADTESPTERDAHRQRQTGIGRERYRGSAKERYGEWGSVAIQQRRWMIARPVV